MDRICLKPDSSANRLRIVWFEFLGTLFLMIAVMLAGTYTQETALGIFFAIIVTERYSGAYMNPSLSLCAYLVRKKYSENLILFLVYWVVEFTACFVGVFLCYSWKGSDMDYIVPVFKEPNNSYARNFFYIIYFESFFTSCLLLMVFCLKYLNFAPDPILGAFAVAMTIYVFGSFGAIMNPGIATANMVWGYEQGVLTSLEYLPAYLVGELLASFVIAPYMLFVVFPADQAF
mmetsp:Transcript_27081/g.20261  ORF Transcript_27081/g.20261 Transcript_27081/m.20261 type:complete len:232 (+) Transcript_27081:29-724(+)|eukprot:CAMPEP_0202971536 /NCGR_PEP_ID=MMETSP1396-20130829/28352_1 /ASSEMBLY_ACC=CAM_ASM_000872 /TAXON_ID= /ORGANISM="Pseudokeronopsis sp., Strain Brazil" /LENGTH=231 /DNA_ID=CAMNT_0049701017 /DNA_START=27 /DNA_END=722 /DNA_ORIENTATION=+